MKFNMKKEALDEGEVVKSSSEKSNSIVKKDIHKGSWISSILKEGKWYLAASLATKAIGFFLLPIYTQYLSPSDYGVLNTLITITELLPIVLSLSIDVAFARFFHDYKTDPEKLTKLYSTVFWFVAIFGGGMLLLFCLSTYFWMESLLEVPAYPYALLAFVPALFAQLNQLGIRFLSQSLQARTASIVSVMSSVINMGLSVILLTEFDMGISGRLWGIAAAAAFNFVFLTRLFTKSKTLQFKFDKKILIECLLYSTPMLLMTASNWINSVSDRLVVAKYVDTEAVGLYALAFQFAMMIDIVGNAITDVLMPITMSGLIHDKENTKLKLSDYASSMWVFMIFLNIGVLLFSKDIITLMADKAYIAAYAAIPILAARKIFGIQYRFFSVIISYHKRTKYFTFASISTATANLILNFIFVPQYGYIAAVWSTFFCEVLYAGIIIRLGYQLEKPVIQWAKYLWSTLLFIGVIVLHYSVDLGFFNKVILLLVATVGLLLITDKVGLLKEYLLKK